MAKIRMFTMVAASLIGVGIAQAGGLPATATDGIVAPAYTSAAASVGLGLPAEFSMLIWAPLLLLTFVCVGGLLWLIRSDAKPNRRRAATRIAKRKWVAPTAARQLAHFHH